MRPIAVIVWLLALLTLIGPLSVAGAAIGLCHACREHAAEPSPLDPCCRGGDSTDEDRPPVRPGESPHHERGPTEHPEDPDEDPQGEPCQCPLTCCTGHRPALAGAEPAVFSDAWEAAVLRSIAEARSAATVHADGPLRPPR